MNILLYIIGPIQVCSSCCADDTYVMSDRKSGLQGALDIVSQYAQRYQVIFNAEKTKIVVTGSKLDMDFFKDTRPWHLDGERVTVVDDNEHLGLILSGLNEEQKNIDNNITQCRNSLFKLLGPALSYKCLSSIVQLHLWKTYLLPVFRSGLSTLPIHPAPLKSLEVFQRKIFRGFLKLSDSSPVPSLFFLLGEVPIDASIHMDLLGLFYTFLSHPQTKLFDILAYMLADTKSSWPSRSSTTP